MDIAGIAAFVLYMTNHPDSWAGNSEKRKIFLLQLGRFLYKIQIKSKQSNPRAIQKGVKSGILAMGNDLFKNKENSLSPSSTKSHGQMPILAFLTEK